MSGKPYKSRNLPGVYVRVRLLPLAVPGPNFPLMDWTDQHCPAFYRLMRRRTLYAEMVASAAVVELNCSNLCKRR